MGVYVLSEVNASLLRVTITGLILLLALSVAFRVSLPPSTPRPVGLLLGFGVGLMIAALGIGGPLIALYLLARGWASQLMRGSLAFYFLAVNIVGVTGYVAADLYTAERLTLIAVVTVPAVAAFLLGSRVVHRLDEATFRKAVLAVIVISSLMVLGREVLTIQGVI